MNLDLGHYEKIVGALKDRPEALVAVMAILSVYGLVQAGVKDWLIILAPMAIFVMYCGLRIVMAKNSERLRELDVREIEAKGTARLSELNLKRLAARDRRKGKQ